MHTNDDDTRCGNWRPPEHEGGHHHVALPTTVLAAAGRPELLSSIIPPPPLPMTPAGHDRLRWEIAAAGCSSGGDHQCNNSHGGSPSGSSTASGYGVTGFRPGGVRCQKRREAYCPPAGFLETDCSPASKLFSTGDLQGIKNLVVQRNDNGVRGRSVVWWSESPLTTESNTIIEGMSKESCRRYTPAEKRERIERYRIKRNLRNFNKKIKYECRKTLADSRPRIRGRFAARNNDNNDESSSCSDDILITTTTPSSSSSITTRHQTDDHQWNHIHHLQQAAGSGGLLLQEPNDDDDDDYDYNYDDDDDRNPTMDIDETCWFNNNLQLIDSFSHFQQI